MGTRCNTIVQNEFGDYLCNMYRHYDGYPNSHGRDLKEFIGDRKLVQGLGIQDTTVSNFNGMECLAADLVAYFKSHIAKGPGGIYLIPMNQDSDAAFTYILSPTEDNKINLRIIHKHNSIFDGLIQNLDYKEVTEMVAAQNLK